jgi:hypothetical protein
MSPRWIGLLVCLTLGCQSGADTDAESGPGARVPAGYDSFGDVITTEGATDIGTVVANLSDYQHRTVKISGTVGESCQATGCWMTLVVEDGDDVMVRFEDYAFFVPKDCAGREVVLDGTVSREERSIDELRHYAEDAGRSAEEIAAITEPEMAISIEASGVLIAKPED